MTLNYLPHEFLVNSRPSELSRGGRISGAGTAKTRPIVEDKLQIPALKNALTRPRLIDLLERAEVQAGVTVLCGRAGAGKTLLAAEFCEKHKDPSWYSIEPADTDWGSFSTYLTASLFSQDVPLDQPQGQHAGPIDRAGIERFLASCMERLQEKSTGECRLVVLDNMHHLFDAEWFPDFFNQLILSLTPNVHVLMLCRAKPQLPLWRLRSKQMLTVIDEDVLAVTASETVRLCRLRGLRSDLAARAHSRSSGRFSRLAELLQQISAF